MRDQDTINAAVREAIRILAAYSEPGSRPNDAPTIARLMEVLDNDAVAFAIERLDKGYGLRVVK